MDAEEIKYEHRHEHKRIEASFIYRLYEVAAKQLHGLRSLEGIFHWGDAVIEGDKVIVTCSEVPVLA